MIRRDAGLKDDPVQLSFVGGMRYGMTGLANWTWPMVRLNLLEEGICLCPSARWLKPLVPIWEARYGEMTEVRSVGTTRMTCGVRFTTSTGDWVIFGTLDRPRVLAALQQRGLLVELEPVAFRYFRPDR